MQHVNLETYQKALEAADQSKKDLLASETIYECIVSELGKTNSSTPTRELIILFGDYVLGLRSQNEVMEELNNLKVPDVYNFFTNVMFTVDQKQKKPEAHPASLEKEIKEMEQSIARAPSIRTMAADMQAVVDPHEKQLVGQIPMTPETEPASYQSSQADILENKPTPTAPPIPRWNSDTE